MKKDRQICTFIDKNGRELASIFSSGIRPNSEVVDLVIVNPALWERGLWFPNIRLAKKWCAKELFFTKEHGRWKHYE